MTAHKPFSALQFQFILRPRVGGPKECTEKAHLEQEGLGGVRVLRSRKESLSLSVVCKEGRRRDDRRMLRTRLLWFGVGFSVAGAAVSQFVWRDLGIDRYALFSDVKQRFDALEARALNLEAMSFPKSSSGQAEG